MLELKREWADGTRHPLFEPLEKLAALTPRPHITLVLSHGVLAPHSRWRRRAVAYEGPGVPLADAITDSATPQVPELRGEAPGQPRYWAGADLMRRAFDLDVLACPGCGGRMRLLATIKNPQAIRQILAHLGLRPRSPCSAHPGPLRLAPLTLLPTCLTALLSACHAPMPPPRPWPVHLEARPILRRLPPSLVVNLSS